MRHSTDYNATVSQLGMGDRFQLEQRAPVHTVARTGYSTDGSAAYVRVSDGDIFTLSTFRQCFIVQHAPRCGCGRRFENCDQDCPWPHELEDLFMV